MIPGQESHMSRLVIPNWILSSPLCFSPLFSFTRTTDSGARLNPLTMSSALPPSHPWPTQFLAWICFGLNSFSCLHWLMKTLERILLCSMKDLDVCEERKWVMGVEKVKQKTRAETMALFANEWNSTGFFVDLPPVLYLEVSSLSHLLPRLLSLTPPPPPILHSCHLPLDWERLWIPYCKDIIAIATAENF